ncbi:MAG: M1 family metallopeptidase [Anaerolineae bacterium]
MLSVRHIAGLLIAVLLAVACRVTTTPAPAPAYPEFRPAMLPAFEADLDELGRVPRYDLELNVDYFGRSVRGQGTLAVPNRYRLPLEELYLRLYPNLPQYEAEMEIDELYVNGVLQAWDYSVDRTSVHVPLPSPIDPGASATISYTWSLQVPEILDGYALVGMSEGILSLPLSYPVLAASELGTTGQKLNWHLEVAPPFADVAFTESALYHVSVTTAPGLAVIGTGTVISQTTTAGGGERREFVTGPVREFMLLLSNRMESVSRKAYDTTVYSHFLPEDRVAGQKALDYGIAVVEAYSDRFGRYPFPELHIVEAPLEYRGFEFPGINLIGIDLYRQRQGDLEFLIAHEVAHQWWYNLVGNDPVNRPWLDEGLAEYSTYIYYETVYGREVAEAVRQNRWEIPVNYARDNGLDTIVGQPASGFGPGNYETMVYGKAALFFHALREAMGDENFFELLRTLVTEYRYQVLTPEILMSQAERIAGQPLMPIYQQWILSAKKLG